MKRPTRCFWRKIGLPELLGTRRWSQVSWCQWH